MPEAAGRAAVAPGQEDPGEVDRIVEVTGRRPEALIPILRALQDRYHYLPPWALRRVTEITDITPADVAGVATFYAQFRHRPAGKHCLRVCVGTACHVKGADRVTDAIRRHLDIPEDADTDADRVFTVEEVACLGCCMLAPVVRIDEMTYGDLVAQKAPHLLRDFLASRDVPAPRRRAPRKPPAPRGEIRGCLCSSCRAAGSEAVHRELVRLVDEMRLAARVKVVGCTGLSSQAPLIEIACNGNTFRYGGVDAAALRSILLEHFRPQGVPHRVAVSLSGWVEKLLTDEAWEPVTRFGKEPRENIRAESAPADRHIATEHAGRLAPLDLEEYVNHDGFTALRRCLHEHSPGDVIRQIEQSGLRGRGGAGFPTGFKWARVREQASDEKCIICNGDEGDPGAFMDRLLLESFPYRVIEGMAIAAYAVGAAHGIFYIRAEYPLAAGRIRDALARCLDHGYLGDGIMGSACSLHLRVVEGAGAFVCGEETALIASIEGARGMPRIRPPFPAQQGLHGKPTLINNVETLSLVPWIIRHGPERFAALGTEGSKGTKTFALAGKVVRGGLIEVPMGMTLREIVEEIGGGVPDGKALKAVQVGGPSGGCLPAHLTDTPVDYDALTATGAIMGSGGLVVLDETDCMVDVARYFLSFTQKESCGKCTHCRVGTKRMLEILDRLCEGRAEPGDLESLEHLAAMVPQGSLCGLGKTAPNPVLTTLRYFQDEYLAHLHGQCPAGKCKALISYRILDTCIGCTLCAQQCPTEAIPLTPYRLHHIDPHLCIQCDICREVCPADAVVLERGFAPLAHAETDH